MRGKPLIMRFPRNVYLPMNITVIGCGRWGSLITWYLDRLGHSVTLYGRPSSRNMQRFLETRSNDLLTLPESVTLSTDISCVADCDTVIISVNSQGLRALLENELAPLGLKNKTIVLCMKGIEISSGKRLSEIVREVLDPSIGVAVWLGPGHVQEFYAGIPNCMVIDSPDEHVKERLIDAFSGELIRFYYGQDMIGNEIGAAAKNVIGIAAGFLDGMRLSTLKGALMSRGTREIARLIEAMGGNPLSAYGLCHLGDYEATVFSPFSHNRAFGECFIRGEQFDALAEGYYTVAALMRMAEHCGVDLPICKTVYRILYEKADFHIEMDALFHRDIKKEF